MFEGVEGEEGGEIERDGRREGARAPSLIDRLGLALIEDNWAILKGL